MELEGQKLDELRSLSTLKFLVTFNTIEKRSDSRDFQNFKNEEYYQEQDQLVPEEKVLIALVSLKVTFPRAFFSISYVLEEPFSHSFLF